MDYLEAFLEKTWDGLLSRDRHSIMQTFNCLDSANQHVVLEHLKKMANETGWHPEQVLSAKVALEAISTIKEDK